MEELIRIEDDGGRFLGKRVLVGITYEDSEGVALRQEQFHGPIVTANARGIVIVRADSGARFQLPPELKPAPPGNYRLRSTGEVVVDPDFLSIWIWKAPPPKTGDDGPATGPPA